MMYSEFCKMSGCKLSYKAYAEKFEPMYMALEMDKREFIDFMLPTIKEEARKESKVREVEERRNQKLVFVSDGAKTPNGCYYLGGFYKLVGCDIKTGKMLVRELTGEEFKEEVYPHFSTYCHSHYDILGENIQLVT